MSSKRFLITSALPYGNGPLHFGHIAGVYLPADIYTRHRKLQGHKVLHISGSDEHGVAIMMNAQKADKPYKEYVDGWHETHKALFDKYNIEFDFFGQTSADYHREETLKWFDNLYKKGAIEKDEEQQLQCQDCKNFLPDRFVEGTCYVCGYEHARGDECPNCGTWIDPIKLKDPECKFCGSHNIKVVDAFQWYLKLTKYEKEFKTWLATKSHWKKTVHPYVESLVKEGLVDRAITRDLDWGIDVPLEEAKGKKLYVWFDAPIGYVSNTKKLLENSDEDYIKDWWKNDETVLTHFIGKDNIIFHALIFPIMSMISDEVKTVDELPANQYVNLFGKQFSKSQGWYVDADEAVEQFGDDALRFYLASLIPEMQDSSFTWNGFEVKINNELANNIGNFINRCLKFYVKNYEEGVTSEGFSHYLESDLFKNIEPKIKEYHEALDNTQFKKAIEALMGMGFAANSYFSDREPWAKIKEDEAHARETLYHASATVFLLGCYFSAFLPSLASNIRSHFEDDLNNEDVLHAIYQGNFSKFGEYLSSKPLKIVKKPKGLVPKVDKEVIKKLEEQFQG